MSYISHEDYKNLMSKFQPETGKSVLKEGLDPVGQEDSDIDNDGDTDKTDKYLLKRRKAIGKAIGKGRIMKEDEVEEYGYADNYPGSWGYREGLDDNIHSRAYDMAAKLKGMGQGKDEVYQFLVNKQNVDGAVAQSMVDDLFGSDDVEGYDDEIPHDYDTFSDYNDGEFWEGVDESEHGDAPISKMSRKDMIEFLGTTEEKAKDMSDEELRDAVEEKNEDMKEGLNPAPMQATGPTIDVKEDIEGEMTLKSTAPSDVAEFVAERHPELALKLGKDREKFALSHAYEAILNSGMPKAKVRARNVVWGYADEDWPSDYLMYLKDKLASKEEGLKPAPMQATGQSLKENTVANPPYGFDVLSPDERKQLKEYIESIKTIKKEIAKLAAKAGKKIKEGGDMTGLTMTPSVTSEGKEGVKVGDIVIPNKGPHKGQKHVVIAVFPDGTFNIKPQWPGLKASQIKYQQGAVKAKPADIQSVTSEGASHEEIEKIESKIPEKLYTAAERVIEELRKAGLNDGEIKMFLDHEIEEKGKEAVMAQHDPF